MDWSRQIDGYCERIDPSFWGEPINAVTNLAFVLAAIYLWRRSAGHGLPRLLAVVLGLIGIGSGLFHTFATAWAALLDVLPILAYVLIYTFAANRHFWGLSTLTSLGGAALVIPWLALLTPVFAQLPGFQISAMYWPIPLLIGLYAQGLRTRLPQVAWGLALGVGILCVSLTARSLDYPLCPVVHTGTHWLWHVLNATMLGWMIEVLRRHLEAQPNSR